MKSFIILSLLIMGCGEDNSVYVEPSVENYLVRFQRDAEDAGKIVDVSVISVTFIKTLVMTRTGLAVGQCSDHKITITENYWENASEARKEALLYHELGHCLLNREHLNEWNNELNAPKTVMYYNHEIVAEHWEANREYYINELLAN